jgi:hypothetical protein
MQPIPENILSQFNAVLERKAVSATLRDYYRKWLRYYLDFRVKYPLPDAKSEQVRLFIEKMWSKSGSVFPLKKGVGAGNNNLHVDIFIEIVHNNL